LLIDLRQPLIFVKPKKCASTSVEIALDILIWGKKENCSSYEELRFFSRRPGGFVTHLRKNPLSWRYVPDDKSRGFKNSLHLGIYRSLTTLRVAQDLGKAGIPLPLFSSLQVVGKFHPHTSVSTIKKVLGDEFWSKALKVTIVRNPWDSVVSDYFWSTRHLATGTKDFDEFVYQFTPPLVSREITEFAGDFDYILRYEALARDFQSLARDLGLTDINVELPRYKSKTRPNEPGNYAEFYDEQSALHIGRLYQKYNQQFGYIF
jgi:hypothetical protein